MQTGSPLTESRFDSIFIMKCLEIADVDDWDKLKGKTMRIDHDWGKIYAIGHIIKDKWFNAQEEFDTLKGQLTNNCSGTTTPELKA